MGRRRRKVKISLQYKILALIFSLIIITMAVIFYYSIDMNLKIQKREIRKSAKQVSDTLSALRLVTLGKTNDVNWKVYEKYMEILAKLDRNIMVMAITDENKDIKAYAINVPIIKKDFKQIKINPKKSKFVKELLDTEINDVLKVRGNLKIKGEQFSEIIIKFSKKSYIRKMNITIINMIILTVILLASGFGGALLLARFITNNFNIIAAGMRKVAEGDLHVEVDVKANDEVGVLADDFNRMIVELREKVRIKDAFETVADGLKDMDDLKKAYKVLTYQEMTDKITKGYSPPASEGAVPVVFVFIDTSSFSSFTFELISEEMKEIIEKFIEKVSLTALEYQGAVFKVTEGYVLLCFGYPFKHEDDMKRAMISTIEIRKEIVSMVKGKLTLGYNIEDFNINFVLINGTVNKDFIDSASGDKYKAVIDYLNFASKYGGKKKYSTDVFAAGDVAKGTANLANYEKIDDVSLTDSATMELYRLKGTKF